MDKRIWIALTVLFLVTLACGSNPGGLPDNQPSIIQILQATQTALALAQPNSPLAQPTSTLAQPTSQPAPDFSDPEIVVALTLSALQTSNLDAFLKFASDPISFAPYATGGLSDPKSRADALSVLADAAKSGMICEGYRVQQDSLIAMLGGLTLYDSFDRETESHAELVYRLRANHYFLDMVIYLPQFGVDTEKNHQSWKTCPAASLP